MTLRKIQFTTSEETLTEMASSTLATVIITQHTRVLTMVLLLVVFKQCLLWAKEEIIRNSLRDKLTLTNNNMIKIKEETMEEENRARTK